MLKAEVAVDQEYVYTEAGALCPDPGVDWVQITPLKVPVP
jgi:hypothetical protein